ncbi:LysM-like peptidoglycan-binding domain-containing protein, partial [Oleiphilus sp. HI0086]
MTLVLALSPSSKVNATRTSIEIDLDNQVLSSSESVKALNTQEPSQQPLIASPTPKVENWQSFDIKSGNTLSTLFAKAGYNDKIMYSVIHSSKAAKQIANIYPGEKIAFLNDENEQLSQIKLVRSPLKSIVFKRDE